MSARRPAYASVVVEADGGSRGNPGLAGYGAVLRDRATGQVIAERGERIGVATNNVAEYRGLIAGLELYREHADGAELEVRMDSKLVVEQMSGRWKIKHPDMRPLALEANRLAPAGTTYTWIPRAQNAEADRLANLAMDGPEGVVVGGVRASAADAEDGHLELDGLAAPAERLVEPGTPDVTVAAPRVPRPPWEQGAPTTLVLVRHGDTEHTRERRFSGSAGSDPGLNEDGRAQVRATAEWLAPLKAEDPVLVSSPMRRTRESAGILTEHLGVELTLEPGLVEAAFGSWEDLTYAEVLKRDPDAFGSWFGDVSRKAGGHGESLLDVDARVAQARDRLLEAYAGRTVLVVSHLTPIKLLTRQVLDMPMTSLFKTELSPASVTVLVWYPDGRSVLRLFNGQPTGDRYGRDFTLR